MPDVHITIDTECSMGGAWGNPHYEPVGPERAILGRINGASYGTPLIMDILEEHGLKGTFFVEVLASAVVGEAALGEALEGILRRGHDTQLHAHPVFSYYAQVRQGKLTREQLPRTMDQIGSLPTEVQRELLEEACAIFGRLTGRRPTAFRAGNYGASPETLRILAQLGFKHDSSFNAAYTSSSCLVSPGTVTNTPWQVGTLLEVPVTTFRTGAGRLAGIKPLEISAVSFAEMRGVLEQAEPLGLSSVTFLLHSFSLLKRADMQFRRMKPDRLVTRRFRRLCRFLGVNRERFPVRTFAEARTQAVGALAALPTMGSLLPAWRRLVQGVNRFYWLVTHVLATQFLTDCLPDLSILWDQ